MGNRKIQAEILEFLSSNGRKVTTREIKNQIFPPLKKTNPKNSFKIVQKLILDLVKKNKVEILDSRSNIYITTKEIENLLKEQKMASDWRLPGIDETSTEDFFRRDIFIKYVKLK